ncbi:hypothetical protein ABZ752_17580 [Streptomyces roseifaciens]
MAKRVITGFVTTGTVLGGQHQHTHHADGTTTTVSSQGGKTIKVVTDKNGDEHVTNPDGSTHTRYSDPQDAFDAMMRSQRKR